MTGLSDLSPYLSGPALLAALAAFGLGVGVLTGLFGVGGGFLVVPLLSVLFGIPYSIAVGSSLAFTIGTGAAGTARHLRLGNVEVKTMLILGGSAVFGALLGVKLQDGLHVRDPQQLQQVMDGLFIALLLLAAWLVTRRIASGQPRRTVLQRLPLPPHIELAGARLAGVSLPGLCAVGTIVGVVSGLMGVGGGVLLLPLLIVLVGLSAHQAVGTSLGVVLFSSVAGTIQHGLLGNVNLTLAMSLLIGSTVGVQMGAWICQKLHATHLRKYFAILVLILVAVLAVRLARTML